MLSRLISLLSRIPAVKWAFNRLRPSPQGGSTDVAPIAASDSPAIVADIAEASPSFENHVSVEASQSDAGIEISAPAAADNTVISAVTDSPSAAPAEISAGDDSAPETPSTVEPITVEEVTVAPLDVESETVDVPELIAIDLPAEFSANAEPVAEETEISSIDAISEAAEAPEPVSDNTPAVLPASAEPVAAEEEAPVLAVEAASVPVEAIELVVSNDPSPELPAEIEAVAAEEVPVSSANIDETPVVTLDVIASDDLPSDIVASEPLPATVAEAEADSTNSAPVALVETESVAADTSDVVVASDSPPSVASDAVPVSEQAPSSAVAVILDEIRAAVSEAGTSNAPVLAILPPPAKRNRAPRTPVRAVDPTDRATLIRQRWEQTGIRMWNPRLHGTGEATLNIQGRIELLPPEAGDSMPRYDKLEFKLLGGQIVCEGVVVDAPASAGQRSFTRLAEPGKPAREPARERRAALA